MFFGRQHRLEHGELDDKTTATETTEATGSTTSVMNPDRAKGEPEEHERAHAAGAQGPRN